MDDSTATDTILVLCGTGTTGRRVVSRLADRAQSVRIGSRTGVPPFDWDDEATWPAAVQGVRAAYVVFYPDLVVPGAVDAVRRFAELARAAGVQRLVLLSGRGEEQARAAERALQEAGGEWTIVRSSFFAQNFSEKFFLDSIREGTFAFAADGIGEPFIDADDIADVVVAALTETGHNGQVYEVTGPRLLSFAEAVAEIGSASGRDLAYESIEIDDFGALLDAQGLPPDYVAALVDVARVVLDGRNETITDGVERALGRKPTDFADFARAAAATGVWAH